MADREFNVRISAETDDFIRNMSEAEREASGLGDALSGEVSQGASSATDSLRETTDELRRLQREAMGTSGSTNSLGDSLSSVSNDADSASTSLNSLGDEADSLSGDVNDAVGASDRLSNAFGNELPNDLQEARRSISELRNEIRELQREASRARASVNGINDSVRDFGNSSRDSSNEAQRLSDRFGGDLTPAALEAHTQIRNLNREAKNMSRQFGRNSTEALNARDAVSRYALGLDDATFKQVYMRSQLGLTDGQLRQQANSIKLNARMTGLMSSQTEILTQRMAGLQRHGIKPEDLLPPSTIGQFQLLNETMAAGQRPISMLSGLYRRFGTNMEKSIKGWTAQKIAIKEAQGDMVKYGLLMRGITAAQASLAMAMPLVGIGAVMAYSTMFKAAMSANEGLKELAETVKSKVATAFEPLIAVAGEFLEVILNMVGRVAELVTSFNEAHPAIAKLLGVIGFLIPVMTLLLMPLALGVGLFNGWKIVINGLWTMFGGLISVIGVGASTFLTLAAIVAGVIAVFALLWNTNEGFRNACIGIWEAIKTTIQTALDNIKQFLITHSDTIKSTIQIAYDTVKTIISTVLDAIKEIVKLVLDNVKQFWLEHGVTVMQAVMEIYDTIKDIIKSILDTTKQIIKTVLDAIKEFWQKHGDTILKVAKTAWDLIKTAIQAVLDVIKSIINGVCSAINGDWDTFWCEVGNIAKIAWDLIKEVVKAGIDAVPGIISAAVGLVKSAIKGVFDAGIEVAKGFGSKMLDVGKDLMKGLADGIKAGASSVVNCIKGAVQSAIDAGKKLLGINSPSKLFMQFGEWTTEGYQMGVDRGEPSSTRAVESFANNSIDAFTTTGLPQNNSSSSNNSIDSSNITIQINAGSLNNERDMYKLAEIIDKKLAEIKQNKTIARGGARVVY